MLEWVTRATLEEVTGEFRRRLAHACEMGGACPVALTGGHSAAKFYDALAQDGLPGSMQFFWSDERIVPLDHPDSNFKLAQDHLFGPVKTPPSHLHPAPVELPPGECARAYAEAIRRQVAPGSAGIPRFPLIILGLGEDGHTGSLFPGRDPYLDDDLLVRAVDATAAHPHPRITFTPKLMNAAAQVWFVVTGEAKAWALEQLQRRTAQAETVPALVVDPAQTRVTIFAGPEASRKLNR